MLITIPEKTCRRMGFGKGLSYRKPAMIRREAEPRFVRAEVRRGEFQVEEDVLISILAVVSAALIRPWPAASQVNPEAAPSPSRPHPTSTRYTRALPIPASGRCPFRTADWWAERCHWPAIGESIFNSSDRSTTTRWGPATSRPIESRRPVDLHVPGWAGAPRRRSTETSAEWFSRNGRRAYRGRDMTPSISFAGGFGGGLTYSLTRNWAVQLTGDRVAASFSLPNNTPATVLLDEPNLERARDVRRGVPVLGFCGHESERRGISASLDRQRTRP
jgi:hypothetical protein